MNINFFKKALKKSENSRMRIVVVGVRGIPNIEGGIETHCEKLYPRLVGLGFNVTVLGRSCFIGNKPYEYKGVKVIPFWAPKHKGIEATLHTFIGVFVAKHLHADILHIHAIGPSIFAPLARMLGMKVVVTHHGPDYDRKKWGPFAKLILRVGEYFGVTFANKVIVISKTIEKLIETKYKYFGSILIPNGVDLPAPRTHEEIQGTMQKYGITMNEYILSVGRLVPEKGFHDLLNSTKNEDIKVVIAGSDPSRSKYSQSLCDLAQDCGAVMTGFVKGNELSDLFYGAALFVLASSHEGLPIALLEAMSYGKNVLVSDIPANLEIGLPEACYYKVGNLEEMRNKINLAVARNSSSSFAEIIKERYNWDLIAQQVGNVYFQLNSHDLAFIHAAAALNEKPSV